ARDDDRERPALGLVEAEVRDALGGDLAEHAARLERGEALGELLALGQADEPLRLVALLRVRRVARRRARVGARRLRLLRRDRLDATDVVAAALVLLRLERH